MGKGSATVTGDSGERARAQHAQGLAEGVAQFLGFPFFDKRPGAGGKGTLAHFRPIVDAEYDDDAFWLEIDTAPRRSNAVDARHLHVHDDEVGAKRPGKRFGFSTVASFADDSIVRFELQEHAQSDAHVWLVIDQEDSKVFLYTLTNGRLGCHKVVSTLGGSPQARRHSKKMMLYNIR